MARQFKVIVADDEKLIANNIARRIEESSGAFRVISRAGTGTEALEQVRELLPDVLFSDIKMPEMDGIELISRLRKEHPGVCCVIVSGYSDFEYMKAAIQNSAVDYLLKPVNTEELRRLRCWPGSSRWRPGGIRMLPRWPRAYGYTCRKTMTGRWIFPHWRNRWQCRHPI